jgi:hypothetical protein
VNVADRWLAAGCSAGSRRDLHCPTPITGHSARKVRSPSAPMGDQERMLQQLLDQGASAGFSLK